MKPLEGKVALVTGGLGTLGRAQTSKLSAEGAAVIVLDRPGHEAEATTQDLGENARFLGCDLNDLARSEQLIRQEAEASGGIDILINNAALIINKPFQDFSLEEYEDQIRVNSSAAFAAVRACAEWMKQKRSGKILNFASITLNGQWDGYVPYVASKGAMIGLTKSLARELGPYGINVNAISPEPSSPRPKTVSLQIDFRSTTIGFWTGNASRHVSSPRTWRSLSISSFPRPQT